MLYFVTYSKKIDLLFKCQPSIYLYFKSCLSRIFYKVRWDTYIMNIHSNLFTLVPVSYLLLAIVKYYKNNSNYYKRLIYSKYDFELRSWQKHARTWLFSKKINIVYVSYAHVLLFNYYNIIILTVCFQCFIIILIHYIFY